MPNKILEGEFVKLRPLEISDAQLTYSWRSSSRSRFLNAGAQTIPDQELWIKLRPSDEYNFIIELKSGVPVGMVSLTAIDKINRRAEPGRFLIGDENLVRGLPIAVEAMKLIYELAFNELGLLRLYGTVAADNLLMTKWQKYLGMREEGRLRKHLYLNNEFQDAICLGLLVNEYKKITIHRMNALIFAAKKPS